MVTKTKKLSRSMYSPVKIEIKGYDLLLDAMKDLVREERNNQFSCERKRTDELDKAVCQMQKTLRSFEVKLNRIEAAQK